MNKTISLALATYNGEPYLEEQLRSIALQTYMPNEIIVCDDFSSDKTIDILESYKNELPLKIFRNKKKLGVIKNFRQAIYNCTGDWVACCDQDDVWLPKKLEDAYNAMESIDGNTPALVYSDLIVTDLYLNEISNSYWKMRNLYSSQFNLSSLLFGNFVTGCTMLMNQALTREMKNIPDGAIMHDYWAALIAHSFGRAKFIDTPSILYRQHNRNVTKNTNVTFKSRLNTLFNYMDIGLNDFLLSEIQQAKLFHDYYCFNFSSETLTLFEKFISLKNRSPICRKILSHAVLNRFIKFRVVA